MGKALNADLNAEVWLRSLPESSHTQGRDFGKQLHYGGNLAAPVRKRPGWKRWSLDVTWRGSSPSVAPWLSDSWQP